MAHYEPDEVSIALDEDARRIELKKLRANATERIESAQSTRKQYQLKLKNKNRLKEPTSLIGEKRFCECCGGSHVVKAGVMYTVDNKIQKWKCWDCNYTFTKYRGV